MKNLQKKLLILLLSISLHHIGFGQSFNKFYHYGENDTLSLWSVFGTKYNFYTGGYLIGSTNGVDFMLQSIDINGDLLWLYRYELPANLSFLNTMDNMDMDFTAGLVYIHGRQGNTRFKVGVDVQTGTVEFAETYNTNAFSWASSYTPDYENNYFQEDLLISNYFGFSPFGFFGVAVNTHQYAFDGLVSHCYPNILKNSTVMIGPLLSGSGSFFTLEVDPISGNTIGDLKNYSITNIASPVSIEQMIDGRQTEGFVSGCLLEDNSTGNAIYVLNVTRYDTARVPGLSRNIRIDQSLLPQGVEINFVDIEVLTSDIAMPNGNIIIDLRARITIGNNFTTVVHSDLLLDYNTLNVITAELEIPTLAGYVMDLSLTSTPNGGTSAYYDDFGFPSLTASIAFQGEPFNSLYLTTSNASCLTLPLPVTIENETVTESIGTFLDIPFTITKDTMIVNAIPHSINAYDGCTSPVFKKNNAMGALQPYQMMEMNKFMKLFEPLTAEVSETLDKTKIVEVFPNPNNGNNFQITLEKAIQGEVMVKVSDVYGRILKKQMTNSGNTLELIFTDQLTKGIYLVTLEQYGNILYQEKVIVN